MIHDACRKCAEKAQKWSSAAQVVNSLQRLGVHVPAGRALSHLWAGVVPGHHEVIALPLLGLKLQKSCALYVFSLCVTIQRTLKRNRMILFLVTRIFSFQFCLLWLQQWNWKQKQCSYPMFLHSEIPTKAVLEKADLMNRQCNMKFFLSWKLPVFIFLNSALIGGSVYNLLVIWKGKKEKRSFFWLLQSFHGKTVFLVCQSFSL